MDQGRHTTEESPEHRLQSALSQLGPDWDESRLEEVPLDEDLADEALTQLPSGPHGASGLRPTHGWGGFLLPTSGIFLILLALIAMGAGILSADVGSLLAAGGFLLIVLAALGRGRRIERAKERKRAEEILLLYGLPGDATRDELRDQLERLRAAKRALEKAREARAALR